MNNSNLTWHNDAVETRKNHHQPAVLWLTGLSGSGKSTLACAIKTKLHHASCQTVVLDGDNIRHHLCRDLGFSTADRKENVRRVAEVSRLFLQTGHIVLSALITPFSVDRQVARDIINTDNFIEIYCQCSLSVCEQRDLKGIYQLAKAGKIDNFTGISSPYEVPKNPDIIINTEIQSTEICVMQVLDKLLQMGIIEHEAFT